VVIGRNCGLTLRFDIQMNELISAMQSTGVLFYFIWAARCMTNQITPPTNLLLKSTLSLTPAIQLNSRFLCFV